MVFQVLSEKPAHVLDLPGPGIVSLPSLLNGRLHGSGLAQVSLLSDLRAGQYAAQEQRHIEGLFQVTRPMKAETTSIRLCPSSRLICCRAR